MIGAAQTALSVEYRAIATPLVTRLRLSDFRNYAALDLHISTPLVALAGPNGAGKTNILEALSLLSPGRGLRRSPLIALPRKGGSGGFVVLADIAGESSDLMLATALSPGETSRECRVDRQQVSSANRFAEHVALLWLTPDQDGLFRGSAGERRRFLDRLVLAIDPAHGARASAFETAMRNRNRVLEENEGAARWLDAIELEMAELGIALAAARLETVQRLAALTQADAESIAPFPFATLMLAGDVEERLVSAPARAVEDWFRAALRDGRTRDRTAGRAIIGPQASDLVVHHGPKGEPAAQCSTGEQKALLVGLILAQAQLIAQMRGAPPILLLDEIAAHLDFARRAALYTMLAKLGGQAFMTGTDANLFEAMGAEGVCFRVEHAQVCGAQAVP